MENLNNNMPNGTNNFNGDFNTNMNLNLDAFQEMSMMGAPMPNMGYPTNMDMNMGMGMPQPPLQNLNVNDMSFLNDDAVPSQVEEDDTSSMKIFNKKLTRVIVASIIIIIDLLITAVFFCYKTYHEENSKVNPDSTYQQLYDIYDQVTTLYETYVPNDNYQSYQIMSFQSEEDYPHFVRLISDPTISYVNKKKILEADLADIVANITTRIQSIDEIKQQIAKYSFLPSEIRDLLGEDGSSTLQRALSSLEIIKFSTASHVFIYLDSILGILSDKTGFSKDDIVTFLQQLTARGEADFSSYVYMCYFNPYEKDSTCNTIGDLDVYYQDILQDSGFNVETFKTLMTYLDSLLEQSDIPNFSILFKNFDPIKQLISFNVEVNLNKQDETSLVKQGIKNPNIYILTNIINGLKQSVFVLGSDIEAKNISVNTRNIVDGAISYAVKTSQKEFSLPVQKGTEREIFDFVDTAFIDQLSQMMEKLNTPLNPDNPEENIEDSTSLENDTTIEKTLEEDMDDEAEYFPEDEFDEMINEDEEDGESIHASANLIEDNGFNLSDTSEETVDLTKDSIDEAFGQEDMSESEDADPSPVLGEILTSDENKFSEEIKNGTFEDDSSPFNFTSFPDEDSYLSGFDLLEDTALSGSEDKKSPL